MSPANFHQSSKPDREERIDVAIAELAPRYMQGYGPLSEEGAADLNGIVAELESAVKELAQYIPRPAAGER